MGNALDVRANHSPRRSSWRGLSCVLRHAEPAGCIARCMARVYGEDMNTGTITASTKALYAAAVQLDKAGLTADERTAKQWAIKAIEARVPAVEAHMEAWADSDNRTGTYIQALGTALRTVGAI